VKSQEVREMTGDEVRIDRWLWATRLFKSRTLAAKACIGGRVDVNGVSAKPHKPVRQGDMIDFKIGDWERKVKVLQLSDKRGPAPAARLLYEDLSPPPPSKEDYLFGSTPSRSRGSGRPTKRERRKLDKLRGN
jgi:ribosome-associated heat shock protein Hsp15